MPDRPICFVISPIGEENSEVRKRADTILEYVITPVAEACGYEALRADKISKSGNITTQIINHLQDDPMVVADLTGANANVFYELAVRHATHKPFVQIIQQGERVPFDVSGLRTIPIDVDIAIAKKAMTELEKQMRAAAKDPTKVENPISVAIDFDRLHRSGDPAIRELANILQGIAEIRALIDTRLPQQFAQARQFPRVVSLGDMMSGDELRGLDRLRVLAEMGEGLKILPTTNANTTTNADGNLVHEEEE